MVFLADMAGVLASRAMTALERLSAAIGLNYGGMDFGLNQDGDPCWDYRRAAVERIHAAVRDLLLTSAGVKRMS